MIVLINKADGFDNRWATWWYLHEPPIGMDTSWLFFQTIQYWDEAVLQGLGFKRMNANGHVQAYGTCKLYRVTC
jgi:hypothetical protein